MGAKFRRSLLIGLAIGSVPFAAFAQVSPAKPIDPTSVPPDLRAPSAEEASTLAALADKAQQARAEGWPAFEAVVRQQLEIERRTFGPRHPLTALSGFMLAAALEQQDRFDAAEPVAREALDIFAARLGQASPITAQARTALTIALERQGKTAELEPLYRERAEADRASLGERSADYAADLTNLAALLRDRGRLSEAEPLYRKSLAIKTALFGEKSAETALGQNNLAALLSDQGRSGEAEPLLRAALETRRALLGDEHPDTIVSYENFGVLLAREERYAMAEPILRKALALRQAKGERDPETVPTLLNLAYVLKAAGQTKEAETLERMALDLARTALGEAHPQTAAALNNLASILMDTGRANQAEALFRTALEASRKSVGYDHPRTALAMNNLASALETEGKWAEAERLHRDALVQYRRTLGDLHPETVTAYANLAATLVKAGKPVEAEAEARTAVRLAREIGRGASVAPPGGEGGFAPAAAKADRALLLRAVYGNYLAIAWQAAVAAPGRAAGLRDSAFTAAQDFTVSAAARAMARATARRKAQESGIAPAVIAFERAAEDYRALDSQLLAAWSRSGDKARAEAAQFAARRVGALAALSAAEAELRRRFPSYADLAEPRPLSTREVRQRLAKGEGLVFIVPHERHVYSFAVSREGVAWHRLEDGATSVDARVRKLQDQMHRAADGDFDAETAFGLYRDLIAPVEAPLGHTKRLYVAAAGPLGNLPLALLLTRPVPAGAALADLPWLGDRCAMIALPSVSALATDDPHGSAGPAGFIGYGAPSLEGKAAPVMAADGTLLGNQPVMAVAPETGEPIFDPVWLRAHYPPLDGPARELPRIAHTLGAGPAAVHLGDAATESAIKADSGIGTARLIAFATHGLLPGPEAPGASEAGLVFTPPDKPSARDDGVLSASEVTGLRFTADFVILSACDTATPDGSSGAEALSSLARAFLYAGAGSLLASHWPVQDEATAALTNEIVAERAAHPELTRAEALQQAMRAVRTGRRADGSAVAGWTREWAHPAFWAPFSLISNRDN